MAENSNLQAPAAWGPAIAALESSQRVVAQLQLGSGPWRGIVDVLARVVVTPSGKKCVTAATLEQEDESPLGFANAVYDVVRETFKVSRRQDTNALVKSGKCKLVVYNGDAIADSLAHKLNRSDFPSDDEISEVEETATARTNRMLSEMIRVKEADTREMLKMMLEQHKASIATSEKSTALMREFFREMLDHQSQSYEIRMAAAVAQVQAESGGDGAGFWGSDAAMVLTSKLDDIIGLGLSLGAKWVDRL